MTMTDEGLDVVRRLVARATGDEKHEESSTSTLDALWVLYDRILRIDPDDPTAEDRDRFILSKGHGPVSFYAILAAHGFFPEEWLDGFMEHGNRLGSHPDRLLVPGVEASTGSLGPDCRWRSGSRWPCAPRAASSSASSCCAATRS